MKHDVNVMLLEATQTFEMGATLVSLSVGCLVLRVSKNV